MYASTHEFRNAVRESPLIFAHVRPNWHHNWHQLTAPPSQALAMISVDPPVSDDISTVVQYCSDWRDLTVRHSR